MSVKIENRIGIAAPADRVWDVLTDFPRWRDWNAVNPEINGKLGMGATLDVVEQLPGREARRLAATVTDWEPLNQILWRVARGPMARSLRFLEIEALTDTACIFANGEVWEGPLGPLMVRGERGIRQRAYRDLGEALKRRVEAA